MTGAAYPQAFAVALETGQILAVTVHGEDVKHGEGLAISAAQEHAPGVQVWDCCTLPLTWKGDDWPPESVAVLRPAGGGE